MKSDLYYFNPDRSRIGDREVLDIISVETPVGLTNQLNWQYKMFRRLQTGHGYERLFTDFLKTYKLLKGWLEHTSKICRKEYLQTNNEIFIQAEGWCKEHLDLWVELQNPILPSDQKIRKEQQKIGEPLWYTLGYYG